MTKEQAKAKAEQLSSKLICPIFLYSIDNDETFKCTVDETYFKSEEFAERKGEFIAEYFDGTEC